MNRRSPQRFSALAAVLALACLGAAACANADAGSSALIPVAPAIGITVDSAEFTQASVASAIAVTPDGSLVVAVNPDSNSVTLVDAETLVVVAEIPVGADPRTLAITPDGSHALVSNQDSGTISAVDLRRSIEVTRWPVGPMPYGVATDGVHAFVSEFAAGAVAVIHLATGETVRHIPVDDFPAGLALCPDGLLLVTHLFTGRVTFIDTAAGTVRGITSTGADTNLSQFVALSSDGDRAYLPQTRPNATNQALLFDTTVFPVVNVVDVDAMALLPRERITLDTADQPVSFPFAVALTADAATAYVLNSSSNDISVIDLDTGRGVAHIDVGANPKGIALSRDGARAFVNNTLDGAISVVSTASDTVEATVKITDIPLPDNVLAGKKIFHAAEEPRLTTDNWISCAVCHFDGMMDGETWQGFPDGPRNTPSLFGVGQTLPLHWSGDLDELQDVELTIRDIQAGTGLVDGSASDTLGRPHAGISDDLDALAAFMASLEMPRSPFRASDDVLARGRAVFEAQECQSCHSAPLYTDRKLHDVGTGDPALERNSHGRGSNFDTPTLRGLWLTAPYFHDGSAATLEDVLRTGTTHNPAGRLTPQQIDDLVQFLRSLPFE